MSKQFTIRLVLSIPLLFIYFPARNCSESVMDSQIRVVHFLKDIVSYDDLLPYIFDKNYVYEGAIASELSYPENAAEWKAYLKTPELRTNEIINTLYNMDWTAYKENKENLITNNSFINALSKNKAALDYVDFAKRISNKGEFYYSWDHLDLSGNNEDSLILDECKRRYAQCSDRFLKERYAYQLVRLSFYANDAEEVRKLYKEHFAGGSSWMNYSAQHYYALTVPEKYPLLLECFTYGRDKLARNVALLAQSNLDSLEHVTTDPKQQASCEVVKALRYPGRALSMLQKIRQLDAENRNIKFLVTREINKIEDWLLTEKVSGYVCYQNSYGSDAADPAANLASDKAYCRDFLSYVTGISANSNNDDKLFYDLSKSYLYFLLDDPGNARAAIAAGNYPVHSKLNLQATIINLLIDLRTKGGSAEFEKEFLALTETIRQSDVLEHMNYYNQLISTVGAYYLDNAATRAKGFLLIGVSAKSRNVAYGYWDNFYGTLQLKAEPDDLDNVLALIQKKDKNAFEKFITRGHDDTWDVDGEVTSGKYESYDTLKILELKALKLIRRDELEKAATVYKTFPQDYWQNSYPDDPFTFSIFDRYNRNNSDKTNYDRLQFLEKLISLKKELFYKPNDPLLNYYIGNAYLSLTYYGKNWYLSDTYLSINDDCTSTGSEFNQNYYGCHKAIPYFRTCMNNTKEEKLRTLSALNYSFCMEGDTKKDMSGFLDEASSGFYKEIQTNCDLYCDYLDAYRQKNKDEHSFFLQGFQHLDYYNFR